MSIRRGDVYFVDLDPVVGREQAGRRPVVVVSNDVLNSHPLVVVAVPGTRLSRSPLPHLSNVLVAAGEAGLRQDTVFLSFQMRALDHSRFRGAPIGSVSPTTLALIEQASAWTLALPNASVSPP